MNSLDKKKTKELEWGEKTYKFIKNILLDAEEKKVPHPVLISQIFSLLTQQRSELLEEIGKGLAKTFKGCSCGLHGYQVLPDCEEEKHKITECADCYLQSLKINLLNKKDE